MSMIPSLQKLNDEIDAACKQAVRDAMDRLYSTVQEIPVKHPSKGSTGLIDRDVVMSCIEVRR